jgi:hypothetical protein
MGPQVANPKIANYYICGRSANLTNFVIRKFADLQFAELISGLPTFASLLLFLRFKIAVSETVPLFSNPAEYLCSKLHDEPVNYSDIASFKFLLLSHSYFLNLAIAVRHITLHLQNIYSR